MELLGYTADVRFGSDRNMMNVLFVCSQNRLRSPTAEQLYSCTPGLNVASAGLNHGAINRVSAELLEWSDRVFVMENNHRNRLSKRFREYLRNTRVTCLDIPDDYDFMDPVLLVILEQKLTPFLGRPVKIEYDEL